MAGAALLKCKQLLPFGFERQSHHGTATLSNPKTSTGVVFILGPTRTNPGDPLICSVHITVKFYPAPPVGLYIYIYIYIRFKHILGKKYSLLNWIILLYLNLEDVHFPKI